MVMTVLFNKNQRVVIKLKIAHAVARDWACHTSQVIVKMAGLPDCHQNQSLGADDPNTALAEIARHDAYEQRAVVWPNY